MQTLNISTAKGRHINNLKKRLFTRVFVIAICVLLVVAFPFYYAYIRRLQERRNIGKTPTRNHLSRLDKFDLSLEHNLDKKLGHIGIGLYQLTGGRITRPYKADVMILTTHGRRSGKARSVLLQFFHEGENLIIVAANSGQPSHPGWFYNLKANPTAHIQIMDRVLQVHAEELSAAEAIALWPDILHTAPSYAHYQQATSRIILLIRLIPIQQTGEQAKPGKKRFFHATNNAHKTRRA